MRYKDTLSKVRTEFFLGSLLVLLILVAYHQVLQCDFVQFDDPVYVTETTQIYTGLQIANIRWAFQFVSGEGTYWHPLTLLSHMLDCQLYGTNPAGHHFTNLLFHITNALLLFFFFNKVTGCPHRSFAVALLFGLHPLNVESVAWVSERKNVLSTFFWLTTLWAYLCYTDRPSIIRYSAVCISFVLGLLTKPMLLTLPMVLLLLDFWPLCRLQLCTKSQYGEQTFEYFKDRRFFRKTIPQAVLEKVPLLILAIAFLGISLVSIQQSGIAVSTDDVPMELRIANAVVGYVQYIVKMFLPLDLSVYYPYPNQIPLGYVALCGLLLVTISLLVIVFRQKRPYLLTGWLWYGITLLPVTGLKQAGAWPAMADRWAYIPLIGLFIILSWGVSELVPKLTRGRQLVISAILVTIAALTILTVNQVSYWKNTLSLFAHAVDVTDHNDLAHKNLGIEYLALGELDKATVHLKKLITISPDDGDGHYSLGRLYFQKRQLKNSIRHYEEAIRLNPLDSAAYNDLGIAFVYAGEIEKGIHSFKTALAINPTYGKALDNIEKAQALLHKGNNLPADIPLEPSSPL